MLDNAFFIVLLLNCTGLFRFVAPQLGVSIGHVSLALLAFGVFYLFARWQYVEIILVRPGMGRWLVLLLVWPLLTLSYAPSFELREIGLQLYYFTLFLGTVVYILANGLPTLYWLFAASLIVTVLGMILSMVAPEYFESVARLADARSVVQGRAIGFFMQPNALAIGLCFLFMGWFSLRRGKNGIGEAITVLLFLGLQLLTGSRAGFLVGAGLAAVSMAHRWPQRLTQGRLVLTAGLLFFGLLAGFAGLQLYIHAIRGVVTRYGEADLIGRMESIATLRFSQRAGLKEDGSIQDRFETQEKYMSLCLERPVTGYGFGSDVYFKQTGQIWLSAHSQALTFAFEYGFFYPFALYVAVAGFLASRYRRRVERALGTNTIIQFVAVFLVLFPYSSMMNGREFYVVLALTYALAQHPRQIFVSDPLSGRFGPMLSRRQIRGRQTRGQTSASTAPRLPQYGSIDTPGQRCGLV